MIQESETLRIAKELDNGFGFYSEVKEAIAELFRLHARVQELEDLNTQLCEQQDVLNDAYAELKQKYDLVCYAFKLSHTGE